MLFSLCRVNVVMADLRKRGGAADGVPSRNTVDDTVIVRHNSQGDPQAPKLSC